MAGSLLVAGGFLFSGSLFLLAITGFKPFGAVTGLGGVALAAAWTVLIVAVLRS